MLGIRSSWRVLASAALAFLLVAGLCGGSCAVAVCSEHDCDPCFQQCLCSNVCRNGLAYDYETVHRLSSYRSESMVAEGETLQIFTHIVGLSLDRAHGPVEHSAADHTRFAEAMIDVNAALLAPAGTMWAPEPVQIFQTAVLVPFRGEGETQRLEFLFDRRGNLVEIHQAL